MRLSPRALLPILAPFICVFAVTGLARAATNAETAPVVKSPAPRSTYHRLEIKARKLLNKPVRRPGPLTLDEGEIAVDTHIHSEYSDDSVAKLPDILLQANWRGLTAIALTDHNTMDGLPAARAAMATLKAEGRLPASFLLIPGEEISSKDGHVIGLFLTSPIPRNLSARETVALIHRQGGIAIAAHPMDDHSLAALANTLPFDAVETVNGAEEARYLVARGAARRRRSAFYDTVTRPRLGASDAHEARMVGQCFTILPDCPPTLEGIRAAILAGNAVPSDPPGSSARTRGITRGGAYVTWLAAGVPTANHLDAFPMIRVPLQSGALTVKWCNGPAVLFRRRW